MKKKILVLTSRFPYPVIGGDRLRIYNICKALSSRYSLTLLSLCEAKQEINLNLPDDGVFDTIEGIHLPKWRSWLNCILAFFFRSSPLQIAYYRHPKFCSRAAELVATHDATLAHLIRTGDAIKDLPGIKFLEMTDAISMNYHRIRQNKKLFFDYRSLVFSLEASLLKKYEIDIVDHFSKSFLVSDVDRQYLFFGKKEKLATVSIASNGVDLKSFPYDFSNRTKDVIFIGNMLSLQNLDAAIYFSKTILPEILSHDSQIRLRLVGRIRDEDLSNLSKIIGVCVTGEVSNIAEAVSGGAVGICPLRLGAGVQNKVLEYMALGLPVVTTNLGLEGFGAIPGQDLIVADDSHDFAERVLELIGNRAKAEQLAQNARIYVEKNHTWEARLAPILESVSECL